MFRLYLHVCWSFEHIDKLKFDNFRANISFNKEVFVDFIAAQIKTLSFLAYIIKIYQVWLFINLYNLFALPYIS